LEEADGHEVGTGWSETRCLRTFRSRIKYVGGDQGEQKIGICKNRKSCIEHTENTENKRGEVWGAGLGGDADCGEDENRISNHLKESFLLPYSLL